MTARRSLSHMATTRTRIVYKPLTAVMKTRDARNPKTHDIAAIRASIRELGFIEPVINDGRTGKTIAGHGRLEALEAMRAAGEPIPRGLALTKGEWAVPVTVGWSSDDDDHAAVALVALNRHTERGGWDGDALAALLGTLNADLLDVTGYDRGDLDDLLAALGPGADQRYAPVGAGATLDPSFAERRDDYANKQVRSIILDYDLDTFAWVAEHADKVRRSAGLDNNAALFVRLLSDATGDNAP